MKRNFLDFMKCSNINQNKSKCFNKNLCNQIKNSKKKLTSKEKKKVKSKDSANVRKSSIKKPYINNKLKCENIQNKIQIKINHHSKDNIAKIKEKKSSKKKLNININTSSPKINLAHLFNKKNIINNTDTSENLDFLEMDKKIPKNSEINGADYPKLINRNKNYDDDKNYTNVNDSYVDEVNGAANNDIIINNKKNNNIAYIKQYLSEDYNIKNVNNITNTSNNRNIINSIMNINKIIDMKNLNHSRDYNINKENSSEKIKVSKQQYKIYENQLSKDNIDIIEDESKKKEKLIEKEKTTEKEIKKEKEKETKKEKGKENEKNIINTIANLTTNSNNNQRNYKTMSENNEIIGAKTYDINLYHKTRNINSQLPDYNSIDSYLSMNSKHRQNKFLSTFEKNNEENNNDIEQPMLKKNIKINGSRSPIIEKNNKNEHQESGLYLKTERSSNQEELSKKVIFNMKEVNAVNQNIKNDIKSEKQEKSVDKAINIKNFRYNNKLVNFNEVAYKTINFSKYLTKSNFFHKNVNKNNSISINDNINFDDNSNNKIHEIKIKLKTKLSKKIPLSIKNFSQLYNNENDNNNYIFQNINNYENEIGVNNNNNIYKHKNKSISMGKNYRNSVNNSFVYNHKDDPSPPPLIIINTNKNLKTNFSSNNYYSGSNTEPNNIDNDNNKILVNLKPEYSSKVYHSKNIFYKTKKDFYRHGSKTSCHFGNNNNTITNRKSSNNSSMISIPLKENSLPKIYKKPNKILKTKKTMLLINNKNLIKNFSPYSFDANKNYQTHNFISVKKIKNKINNTNNSMINKYYNYFLKKDRNKKHCLLTKKIKKNKDPIQLPIISNIHFFTKQYLKYFKKPINKNICYCDKKIISNIGFELLLKNNNLISDSESTMSKKNLHNLYDADINLTFSTDELNKNTHNSNNFIYNSDSISKITFGTNNINNNIKKTIITNKMPTSGRSIAENKEENDKIYDNQNINSNNENKINLSSIIICDNEEENEDIRLSLSSNKEEDFNNNMNGFEQQDKDPNNDPNNMLLFSRKLENILDNNTKNINEIENNNNDYDMKEFENKCKTYKSEIKYFEVLKIDDNSMTYKYEPKFECGKEVNNNDNKINIEINSYLDNEYSENENDITFDQNKMNYNSTLSFKHELTYLLNIITIDNFSNISNKIASIIIRKNETLNNIIDFEYIFVELITDKAINENNYSMLYALLCKEIHFLLLKKNHVSINNENIKSIILMTIKLKFEELNNQLISNDDKIQFKNFLNFVLDLTFVKIIKENIGFEFLDILLEKYLGSNNDYFYLEQINELLSKMNHIVNENKNEKNILILKNFIYEKIYPLIHTNNINNSLPKYFLSKVIDILNSQNNKIKYSIYEQSIINKYDSILLLNSNSDCDDISLSVSLNIGNVISPLIIYNKMKNSALNLIFYNGIYLNIKNVILNNEENIYDFFKESNFFEVINNYLEFCIDYIDSSKKVIFCNKFIKNFIENYFNKNKKNIENDQILILLRNIDNVFVENIFMIEIVGYLIYLMINYKIMNFEDLNVYENDDKESIINIAMVVKYIISYYCMEFSDSNNKSNCLDYKKKIIDEFRDVKVYQKNKEIFEKCLNN